MKRIKLYEEFVNEANNLKTLKGFLKALKHEYGPTPSEQSLADFIYNNYKEVTGENLKDSDPASNDHIADIIAHFRMDGEDFMIAWEDRMNESVNEGAMSVTPESNVKVDDYTTDAGELIKAAEIVGAIVSSETEKEFTDYFYDQYGLAAFTENDIATLVTSYNEYVEEVTDAETEAEEDEEQADKAAGGEEEDPLAGL